MWAVQCLSWVDLDLLYDKVNWVSECLYMGKLYDDFLITLKPKSWAWLDIFNPMRQWLQVTTQCIDWPLTINQGSSYVLANTISQKSENVEHVLDETIYIYDYIDHATWPNCLMSCKVKIIKKSFVSKTYESITFDLGS